MMMELEISLEVKKIHSSGIKKFVNLTEKKFNIIKGRCFGTVQFFDRNIEKMMKSFCKQLDD